MNSKQIKAIVKALKTQKVKPSAETQLKNFMTKKGFKVISETAGTYTRLKDNKQIPVKYVTFNTPKTASFCVTAFRFWKL